MATEAGGAPKGAPVDKPATYIAGDKFNEVRKSEKDPISKRRAAVVQKWPEKYKDPDKKDPDQVEDLVGLALSGGGIRAASVGLGALQALQQANHYCECDYLSTVSGGGYIGGYISAAAVSEEKRISVESALAATDADKDEGDFGQPHLVRRFIFGGKYLLRPWEAANKYLSGLFFHNVLVISGLLMVGSFVAFWWRLLDFPRVREVLGFVGLDSGVTVAFLPFLILLTVWACCWFGIILRQEGEAPEKWTQRLLYCVAASFAIGVAMLLVNTETTLGFSGNLLDKSKIVGDGTIGKGLLGLLVACLTPLLRPEKLLQYGKNPKNVWQRAVFQASMFALLIGAPLALIALMAKPDISGTAIDSENKLRRGDILNWPAFIALIDSDKPVQLTAANKTESEKAAANDRRRECARLHARELREKLAVVRRRFFEPPTVIQFGTTWYAEWPHLGDVREYCRFQREIEDCEDKICHVLNDTVLNWKSFPLAVLHGNLLEPEQQLEDHDLKDVRRLPPDTSKKVKNSSLIVNWIRLFTQKAEDIKREGARANQDDKNQAQPRPDKAEEAPLGMFAALRHTLLKQQQDKLTAPELDEDIEDARLSYHAISDPRDIRGFNLRILRALHDECFYTQGKAYRWLVIGGDEMTRVWLFCLSGLVFVGCGLFINFNKTSVHRFYRNRLKQAYLSPQLPDGDQHLSDMATTEKGWPYHLINATIDMTRPRSLADVDQESKRLKQDRRDVQNFLFSQLYCGSTATGWARTQGYEELRRDNVSFADAIALSGSAVDPFRAGSLGLTVAMSALNLTLGQWLPNPKRREEANRRELEEASGKKEEAKRKEAGPAKPKELAQPAHKPKGPSYKPTFFALWRDWFKKPQDRTFCYVSDGGFADNLGIMALLRRRCRLIVAVDASCDGTQAYVDLNWVIRAARLNEGIRIIEPRKADDNRPEEALSTVCLDVGSNGLCDRHFLLARVIYPDSASNPAWLVYLKPSFTGDEGADLLRYRLEAPNFPNDDTADQFYDPARAESYRQLGFHIANDFCRQITDTGCSTLLKGVEQLEPKFVKIREEAEGVKKMRRNLPLTGNRALETGVQVSALIEMILNRAREGDSHRREFEQKVSITLQAIKSHLARATQNGYQSGKACTQSGRYIQTCAGCGHSETRFISEGSDFPTCQECGAKVTWTPVPDVA